MDLKNHKFNSKNYIKFLKTIHKNEQKFDDAKIEKYKFQQHKSPILI